jgi:hypothetical protein
LKQGRVKQLIAIIALGVFATPAAAYAQQQQPSQADMQKMQAIPQEIDALRKQAHTKMIAALTPENRALVAKLAASTTISPDKADKMVDQALSKQEVHAVLAIDTERRAQQAKLLQQAGPGLMLREDPNPDPGQLLLDNQHLTLMTPQ